MDKNIKCIDCGVEFLHSVRDQEFYTAQSFSEPKRCRDCRAKKKANQNQGYNRY